MTLNIRKIPHEDAVAYMNFTTNLLSGYLRQADTIYRSDTKRLLQTSRALMHNITQQFTPEPEIYRGVCLKSPGVVRIPANTYTFYSFSESKAVACHFADSSENGFGRERDMVMTPQGIMPMHLYTATRIGSHGYIMEHRPDYMREVLFHFRLLSVLPYNLAIGSSGVELLYRQKEVVVATLGRSFPLTPIDRFLATHGPQPYESPTKTGSLFEESCKADMERVSGRSTWTPFSNERPS